MIQFSAASYSVNENAGVVTITVTRTGSTTSTSTVRYSGTNGTAKYGTDYGGPNGSLSFARGETSKRFTVSITDDDLAEGSETFNLALSDATGAGLGSPNTAVVTIVDNDKQSASVQPRGTMTVKGVRAQ